MFSSCVAGIVYAFGGSVGAFAQVNLFYATIWIPAVFWCYAQSLQVGSWKRQLLFANLAGLALALSLLAGHHQPFIYTSLAVAGIATVLWLKSKKSCPPDAATTENGFPPKSGGERAASDSAESETTLGRRPAAPVGTVESSLGWPGLIFKQTLLLFIFGLAYASLQLLPSLEYSRLAYRWIDNANPSLVSQRVPYSIARHGQCAATPRPDREALPLSYRGREQPLCRNSADAVGAVFATVGQEAHGSEDGFRSGAFLCHAFAGSFLAPSRSHVRLDTVI